MPEATPSLPCVGMCVCTRACAREHVWVFSALLKGAGRVRASYSPPHIADIP